MRWERRLVPRQSLGTRLVCGVVGVLLFTSVVPADDAPPVRGRPLRFSGAIGSFRVTTHVERPEVRVGEPFLLTVRIAAGGTIREPPVRPDLRDLPSFAGAFHIDPLGDANGTQPEKSVWEFQYRLRAKSTSVESIPSLPFVYYRPAIGAGARGAYQTAYAPRVPLTVRPADAPPVTQRTGEKPSFHPESVYELATGPGVLRRPFNWDVSATAVVFILVATPLGCGVWYLVWRRMNPDAARVARRRRSVAARQALADLAAINRRPAAERARSAAEVVAVYLRHRLDLATTPLSPDEVEARLKQFRLSEAVIATATGFFRDADAARFAPDTSALDNCSEAGSEVVLMVEAETCSPP